MTLTNFLIAALAFILFLVIMGQIGKVSDLVSGSSKDEDEAYEDTSSVNGIVFLLVGLVGMGLMVWSYIAQSDKYLPPAASELGRDWDFLFYVIFSPPIILVFFITHITLFYFAFKYRFKKKRKAWYFSHSNKLEIIWTAVPLITMIVLGFLTIPKWVEATAKPGEDALHIRVTGHQFKWFIAYPGTDDVFGSRDIRQHGKLSNLLGLDPEDEAGYDDVYTDAEIVIPKGREISFDLSALDVLHDFYLPHFRVKMDCVPGVPTRIKIIPDRTTEEMREITGDPSFEFEVACAELCGQGHWNMRRVLRVVEPHEYEAWFAEQALAKDMYYDNLLAELEEERAMATDDDHHGGDDHNVGDDHDAADENNDDHGDEHNDDDEEEEVPTASL